MPSRRRPVLPASLIATALALGTLALGACGSSSPQSLASAFIGEHRQQAERVREGAVAANSALAALARPPTPPQLSALARAAQRGHDLIAREHGEWVSAEGGAEETLSLAEIEADVGANEMRDALGGLVAYAAHPDAVTLARYEAKLRVGREKWNEAVGQLWHLGGASNPPTVP
jgi:hypothetical protein